MQDGKRLATQQYCRKSPSFTVTHKLIMSQKYHTVAK